MEKSLEGVLHFFTETGTEGGYWAFQDLKYITKNTTRFACEKCGCYWDQEQEPDGPTPLDNNLSDFIDKDGNLRSH